MAVTYTTYDARTPDGEWSGVFRGEREARYWASTRPGATVQRVEGQADGSTVVTQLDPTPEVAEFARPTEPVITVQTSKGPVRFFAVGPPIEAITAEIEDEDEDEAGTFGVEYVVRDKEMRKRKTYIDTSDGQTIERWLATGTATGRKRTV